MRPTMELRFVEREVTTTYPNYFHITETKTVRILQQKWTGELHENRAAGKYVDEWRDVPIEKE